MSRYRSIASVVLGTAAVALDYGTLALGHHVADAVITTLMNLMGNGRLFPDIPRVPRA